MAAEGLMKMSLRPQPLRTALRATAFFLSVWVAAACLSPRPLQDSLLLSLLQGALSFLATYVLLNTLDGDPFSQPGATAMLALHVLLYYGIANISPALFPESRPALYQMFSPVPAASPVSAYAWGTVAACCFIGGVALGGSLGAALLPDVGTRPVESAPWRRWLPGYQLSLAACLLLVLVMTIGTARFGLKWGAILESESPLELSFFDQLLFYGSLPWMPVIPLLAASAILQAASERQRRRGVSALIFAEIAVVGGLTIWRIRSMTMAALVLPLVLLAHVARLRWRSVILPVGVLAIAAYVVVTIVRLGNLPALAVEAGGFGGLAGAEVVEAVTNSANDSDVGASAVMDLSYRAAGLEAVAAIVNAQQSGEIDLQLGMTVLSGFLQALPAGVRRSIAAAPPIKTAPAHFRVFEPGDWVSSILAELVFDFGPVLLLVPAILVGLLLTLIDRALLLMGERERYQGILIVRMAWLVSIVFFEVGLADRTLLFFKATSGYIVILVMLGLITAHRTRFCAPSVGSES